MAGYAQHKRHSELPCDSCKAAKREYANGRNRRLGRVARTKAICGMVSGYARHYRNGERPCEACREAKLEDQRNRRGQQPFTPARCGTRSGYQRHWRAGEQACEPCIKAYRDSAKPRRYWNQLREAQGGRCDLCDQTLPPGPAGVAVDHIIPRSKEGSDDLDNLQAVHPLCNTIKCNRDNAVARALILRKVESGEWALLAA